MKCDRCDKEILSLCNTQVKVWYRSRGVEGILQNRMDLCSVCSLKLDEFLEGEENND